MVSEIASKTHGFVGADLLSLSKEAAMVVLRKVVPDLDLKKTREFLTKFLTN